MTSWQIPEADWRRFKEVHGVLLERYCAGILVELATALKAGEGTARERYLRAHRLIGQRHEDMARAFSDFRRSTAVMQLGIMRGMGLLTERELGMFSEKTQVCVRALASR
jgi:hypothetical protein